MKIILALLLVFSQAAHAETMSEYIGRLSAEVLILRNQVKSLSEANAAQDRALKENYAALRVYIADFTCKHNRLFEIVSAGTKVYPVFPKPVELIRDKACDGVSPQPPLPTGF